MILVEAAFDLTFPQKATPQFIQVAPFGHEHVAYLEFITLDLIFWQFNRGDFIKTEKTVLDICGSEIRALNNRTIIHFSKSNSRLCCGDPLERNQFPADWNLLQPGIVNLLKRPAWVQS